MSEAYKQRKKYLKKENGKDKRNGYWELIKATIKGRKGRRRTQYRTRWYGV
jgi:hypothetical protein